MRTLWNFMTWKRRIRYVLYLLWMKRILLAFLVLAAAMMGAIYFSTNNALKRERAAQIKTCVRVQILRDQANGTNFLIYDTFKHVVMQQQKALASKTLKGTALKQARDAINRAQAVVNTTLVTGPTDCIAATDSPGTYKAPSPEFIAKGGPRVALSRKRANVLVLKAKRGEPLYGPNDVAIK
jgi:hypothetical protein